MSSNALIRFANVSHRYEADSRDILSHAHFELARGEMAFLTGPSGAGKSTMLKLIARLARPTSGEITVDGVALSRLRERDVPAAVALARQALPEARALISQFRALEVKPVNPAAWAGLSGGEPKLASSE